MNVVLQQSPREDADFVEFLENELGFARVVLRENQPRFAGKLSLLMQVVRSSRAVLALPKSQRNVQTLIAIGHFAFAVKVLARLGFVRYERLFCSGFFVRSLKWFPLFRALGRIDTFRDHYLVFSRAEIELYTERLGIDRARIHYIPCGDWRSPLEAEQDKCSDLNVPAEYYFSGGYSNRDYVSLIEAFRGLSVHLVIVCSKLNRDIDDKRLPGNVRVIRDVSSDTFESFVRHAKAGIVPLKHDFGSSGQTVVLRLMRHAKPIVVSDSRVIRDYIEPGVSAYIVSDLKEDLPKVITGIETDPDRAAEIGKAAYERYLATFSRPILSASFQEILRKVDTAPSIAA